MRFVVVIFASDPTAEDGSPGVVRTGPMDTASAIATASRMRGAGRFAYVATTLRSLMDLVPEMLLTAPFVAAMADVAKPRGCAYWFDCQGIAQHVPN